MKYLFINSVEGVRSTGKLIESKCCELEAQGHECVVAYGRETLGDSKRRRMRIGTRKDYLMHAAFSRVLDCQGFMSKRATHLFLKEVEAYAPNVIWLHNLHGYYIHIEELFDWLKAHSEIKVYWTLHDCWAFTGHCSHFTLACCERWKTGCKNCSQKKEYPVCYGLDRSRQNYIRKKRAFCGVKDMTIIVPSNWLKGLVEQSFLKEYAVEVQNNRIDKTIFYPRPSDFRKKNNLENKYIVLGVAVGWEHTKGYQDIHKFREKLDDRFVILLVGTTQKQIEALPEGIVGLTHTKNQHELAEIYTAADVLINPTHQDNYPTVNLEARACGTPVVTYNVGGSPESAGWEHIIEENDIDAFVDEIYKIVGAERQM